MMDKQQGDQAAAHSPSERVGTLRRELGIVIAARTTLNTAHRIIYPFLPSIARGLGVSVGVASGLVTARMVAGLVAPLIGPLSDRAPRRRTMEVALLIFALAGVLLVGTRSFAVASVAFALYGLAKVIYDPSVHAYLGDTVPYARRGRVFGFVELAWSGAWLLGVPISGILSERFGWRAPWAVLTLLGLLSFVLTRAGLPPGDRPAPREVGHTLVPSLFGRWKDLLRNRRIVVLLLTSLLFMAAVEVPFIVYGAWLETAFGLSLSTLGLASTVIGIAEASAELGTAAFTDRLGKKRSVLAGLLVLALGLTALPWLAQLGLATALGGFALVMLAFEFGIVSLLPLASELAPGARASLLSLNITAMSFGRILGAVAGGWLWEWSGGIVGPNALVGAACAALAAILMKWGMAEIGE
jgi:predicted MFS family arabinose efflux permease